MIGGANVYLMITAYVLAFIAAFLLWTTSRQGKKEKRK
jgi:hypothetical protein